jgi:large subunit ribosomal protein L15
MKLHDLQPAAGSRKERTRVGRGIAAGKGKTAGRGTKGQKARAGGSIPPWFEGGQTPLHQRIPKLRGFRNRFKTDYEVVNVGRIDELVEAGRIPSDQPAGRSKKAVAVTVNQEVLRAAGLVRTLAKPMKVLGTGDVARPLFVVADAFTRSAREKIESAGGTAQLLETPAVKTEALRPAAEPTAAAEPTLAAEPEPEPETTPTDVETEGA